MDSDIEIIIAQDAEDLWLASMLKDLMAQNLEQNPHKKSHFKNLDIGIGLIVADAGIELTMAFARGVLTLHSGISETARLIITADSDVIMNLSNVKIKWGMPYYFDETGKEIIEAMKKGRLKMKGMFTHFLSLLRLSRVMSVHP